MILSFISLFSLLVIISIVILILLKKSRKKRTKWCCENKKALDSDGMLTSCSCIEDEVNGTYQSEQECKSSCCYTCDSNTGFCTASSTCTLSQAACKLLCVDSNTVTVLPFSNTLLESQMENGQTQCNSNFDRNCDGKATPWGDASNFACKSNYCRDEVSVRNCDEERCRKVKKKSDCPGYTPTGYPKNTNCEWVSGKCTPKLNAFGVCSKCKKDTDCDAFGSSHSKCENGKCINSTKTSNCFIPGASYNYNKFVSPEIQNACHKLWNSQLSDLHPCRSKKLLEKCRQTNGENNCISKDGRDLGTMYWDCMGFPI